MQNSKLYVGNLTYSSTEQQVKELFNAYGEVKSIKLLSDKGFGFVEMSTAAEAEKARMALNGQDFNGRQIKVDEARPMTDRNDRGGNGGGGGGSRRFNNDRRY